MRERTERLAGGSVRTEVGLECGCDGVGIGLISRLCVGLGPDVEEMRVEDGEGPFESRSGEVDDAGL